MRKGCSQHSDSCEDGHFFPRWSRLSRGAQRTTLLARQRCGCNSINRLPLLLLLLLPVLLPLLPRCLADGLCSCIIRLNAFSQKLEVDLLHKSLQVLSLRCGLSTYTLLLRFISFLISSVLVEATCTLPGLFKVSHLAEGFIECRHLAGWHFDLSALWIVEHDALLNCCKQPWRLLGRCKGDAHILCCTHPRWHAALGLSLFPFHDAMEPAK
mmetsp:Transcript_64938/g.79480  ORF Transcript_64938/g.79480 Transcript_64938/m.79480 type:complete len:212 (-) Transcript_64938:33-668(-)